jgi:hypothetical protein
VSDHWEQELAKAFEELKARVEKLAQERASTEAVLYAKDRVRGVETARQVRVRVEL